MPGSDDVTPSRNTSAPQGPDAGDRPSSAGVKLTYDDFLLFPDDGKRHELISGEHYVTPSSNVRHQEISGRLHLLIGAWLAEHQLGKLYFAPLDVILSRFDVVEPDLLYISKERAVALLGQHVTGAPDLVVEIASPGTRRRDETIKRRLYEAHGVREYWIVDPDIDVIRVYSRTNDRFGRAVELSSESGDVLRTPLLPGLEIPLAHILEG